MSNFQTLNIFNPQGTYPAKNCNVVIISWFCLDKKSSFKISPRHVKKSSQNLNVSRKNNEGKFLQIFHFNMPWESTKYFESLPNVDVRGI